MASAVRSSIPGSAAANAAEWHAALRAAEGGSDSEDEEDRSDEDADATEDEEASVSSKSRKRKGSNKPGGGKAKKRKKGPPSPVLVNGVETWTVSKILAEDVDEHGTVVYLIKWDGWTGADTWEPMSSIQSCKRALSEWKGEKNAQLAAAKDSDLVNNKLVYPIHHRGEKKVRAQKRSYASDQAWHERQCLKAEQAEQRKKDAEKRAQLQAKKKAMLAAKEAKLKGKDTLPKETPEEREKREEAQRKLEEEVREARRKEREAELECSEPFYYVTADDSLLMACMDSEEEEEWGVSRGRAVPASSSGHGASKMKPSGARGAPKSKKVNGNGTAGTTSTTSSARLDARPIPPIKPSGSRHTAADSPDGMDFTHDDDGDNGAGIGHSEDEDEEPLIGYANRIPAQNTTRIDVEEWSEDDLMNVGDNRGSDAKLKRFAAQFGVEELLDIVNMREMAPSSSGPIDPTAPGALDRFEYLVRWHKSTLRPLSWEPESALKGAQPALQAFLKRKAASTPGWTPVKDAREEKEEEKSATR